MELMAKRFTDTEIWDEDWFLDLPNDYKLFWFYILSKCDHAGLFKVNLRSFRGLIEVTVTPTEALAFFNSGKDRIRVISETLWFIEDFFVYQYGTTFNFNNRMHDSIGRLWKNNNIPLTSIRGLKEVKDRVKDKDKDKDILGREEKGGVGEKEGEGFVFGLETELPASTLESVELNQFTHTRKKNTEFILSMWKVFLSERLNDPPIKKQQHKSISDLTGYFQNFMREKFPKPNGSNQQSNPPSNGKLGTSAARVQAAKDF